MEEERAGLVVTASTRITSASVELPAARMPATRPLDEDVLGPAHEDEGGKGRTVMASQPCHVGPTATSPANPTDAFAAGLLSAVVLAERSGIRVAGECGMAGGRATSRLQEAIPETSSSSGSLGQAVIRSQGRAHDVFRGRGAAAPVTILRAACHRPERGAAAHDQGGADDSEVMGPITAQSLTPDMPLLPSSPSPDRTRRARGRPGHRPAPAPPCDSWVRSIRGRIPDSPSVGQRDAVTRIRTSHQSPCPLSTSGNDESVSPHARTRPSHVLC